MGKIEDLRVKVNQIISNSEENDENILKLTALIDELLDKTNIVSNKFLEFINNSRWVNAVEPIQICNRDSEEEKNIRGSVIFNLLISNKLKNYNKPINEISVLDFGSGEGHIAKHTANSSCQVFAYDIENNNKCNVNFTTNFEEISSRKYDFIFMYDVLDHSIKEDPADILKKLKPLLNDTGKMIIRCHPWCSRHGTHHWTLNKAYAHLFLSERELEKLGHKGIPTRVITHPKPTYRNWITVSDLKIEMESPLVKSCGIYIENGWPGVKSHLQSLYPNKDFNYEFIETEFIDYVLTL